MSTQTSIEIVEGLRDSADFVPSIVFDGKVYFSTTELGCRCDVCKGKGKLAPGFREALLGLRLVWNRPMAASSCCRCLVHNEGEGGASGSYHIYETAEGCCAIDITEWDSVRRAELVELALRLGWRVGVNKAFVHLDWSPTIYPRLEKKKLFLY